MFLIRFSILCVCVVVASSGCAQRTTDLAAPLRADASFPEQYSDIPWATVLRENVKEGLVDYAHLAAHREPLDEYLRMLATFDPVRTRDAFPTREARMCYYINAFNAGLVAAVLEDGIPESLYTLPGGQPEFRYRVLIGQTWRKLSYLRERALSEADGDMRVLFALCTGAVGSPPLPSQPLRPDGVEDTLRRLAQKAMDNPHIVAIDHENQWFLLSATLDHNREAFIESYCKRTGAKGATMLNVVADFANSVRRQWLNTAVGYAERRIPFDRALNRWTPPHDHTP
jgi:Protein of unknown function, DUF547